MRQLILPALLLAFTVFCLVDVVRSPGDGIRGLPKTLWVFVVLLFPLAGGIGWLVAGRPKDATAGGRRGPRGPRNRPAPRTLGPDDDPDFLRSIEPPREDGPRTDASGDADPAPEDDERDDRRP